MNLVTKAGNDAILLVKLTAMILAILHKHGNGLVLLDCDGVFVVGVGAGIVRLCGQSINQIKGTP